MKFSKKKKLPSVVGGSIYIKGRAHYKTSNNSSTDVGLTYTFVETHNRPYLFVGSRWRNKTGSKNAKQAP